MPRPSALIPRMPLPTRDAASPTGPRATWHRRTPILIGPASSPRRKAKSFVTGRRDAEVIRVKPDTTCRWLYHKRYQKLLTLFLGGGQIRGARCILPLTPLSLSG